MLSGIKVIPREELLDEDSLRADKLRKTRREYHHNSSDECSKGDERRARKGKKMSGTHNFSDIGSFCGKESNSDSDGVDKGSKSRKKRRFHHDKDNGKKRNRKRDQSVDLTEKSPGNLRKEMGLDWMLQPGNSSHSNPAPVENEQEPEVEEEKNVNPKELNPYLRDNGTGYPDDASNSAAPSLLPSSLVGDGGASWRLKALKRSKEQATREGRTLQEVVGERWDSLQELATSVAVHPSAPAHAHLHAIRERKTRQTNVAENNGMKKSKQDNLLWRSKYSKKTSLEDNSLISEAVSSINKFSNDGSFLDCILNQKNKDAFVDRNPGEEASTSGNKDLDSESRDCDGVFSAKRQALSSNQLAAKVLRLKMEGKHEEAENISKRMDALEKNSKKTILQEIGGSTSRCIEKQLSSERMKHEDDADKHLVQKIMQSKRYSISESADDEYDDTYGEASSRKHNNKKLVAREYKTDITRKILTQKERCQFCFENSSRPKHLVVSIGNATYLMLPTWEPVVQGHCCILPLQHESATRTIDKNVWEELRNFKKCLLKMFSREGKDVIFLETAIGLSRQRRHCLIECIPIPSYDAKQAPLYFKKAIDEAEGEWGQHDMKKVIPTNGNLRNVIPENFSYFHVEFGLDNGFVHVIDDDTNFPSSFGSNVIRGMLRLPEETMHHHQRQQPADKQKQSIADFVREWKPFDWTSALE